jgi:hypothetical protein
MKPDDYLAESLQRDALHRDYVTGGALAAMMAANMTVRTCAAMLAPPAPDWFKHKETRPMPGLPDPMVLSAADRDALALAGKDLVVKDPSPELSRFIERRVRAEQRVREWRDEQREQKYWAWRWYYAEQIVKGAPDA